MQSVLITGRRWFNRTHGNTYFSSTAYVDGEQVAHIPFAYGYGDYYVQAMTDKLEELGYMPERVHYANGSSEPGFQYFRDDRGVNWTTECCDVQRRKDL